VTFIMPGHSGLCMLQGSKYFLDIGYIVYCCIWYSDKTASL